MSLYPEHLRKLAASHTSGSDARAILHEAADHIESLEGDTIQPWQGDRGKLEYLERMARTLMDGDTEEATAMAAKLRGHT